MIAMRATKPLRYESKALQPGDLFHVKLAAHARLLAATRRAVVIAAATEAPLK